MIAFEVRKNGRKVCTAGVSGTGVVFAMVRWVTSFDSDSNLIEKFCDLDVFGVDDAVGKHQQWANPPLVVGDEIVIRVVTVARVDPAKIGD